MLHLLSRQRTATLSRQSTKLLRQFLILSAHRTRTVHQLRTSRSRTRMNVLDALNQTARRFLHLIHALTSRTNLLTQRTHSISIKRRRVLLHLLNKLIHLTLQCRIVVVRTLQILRLQVIHNLLTSSNQCNQRALHRHRRTEQGAGHRTVRRTSLSGRVFRADNLTNRSRKILLAVRTCLRIRIQNSRQLNQITVHATATRTLLTMHNTTTAAMRNRHIGASRRITQHRVKSSNSTLQLRNQLRIISTRSLRKILLQALNIRLQTLHSLRQRFILSLQMLGSVLTQGRRRIIQALTHLSNLRTSASQRRINLVDRINSALQKRHLRRVLRGETVSNDSCTRQIRSKTRLHRNVEGRRTKILRLDLQHKRRGTTSHRRCRNSAPLNNSLTFIIGAHHTIRRRISSIRGRNNLSRRTRENSRSSNRERSTNRCGASTASTGCIIGDVLGLHRQVLDRNLNRDFAAVAVQIIQVSAATALSRILQAHTHRKVINDVLRLELHIARGARTILVIDVNVGRLNRRNLAVTTHLNIHVLQNISSVLYLAGTLRSNSTLIGRGAVIVRARGAGRENKCRRDTQNQREAE